MASADRPLPSRHPTRTPSAFCRSYVNGILSQWTSCPLWLPKTSDGQGKGASLGDFGRRRIRCPLMTLRQGRRHREPSSDSAHVRHSLEVSRWVFRRLFNRIWAHPPLFEAAGGDQDLLSVRQRDARSDDGVRRPLRTRLRHPAPAAAQPVVLGSPSPATGEFETGGSSRNSETESVEGVLRFGR